MSRRGASIPGSRGLHSSIGMARPSLPASSEPMSRGTILHGVAAAVHDLWGDEGLRDVVSRLPEETRAATTGPAFTSLSWYPTRYLMEWDVAKMAGPAHGDEEAFRQSLRRGTDFGFGRVRRAFLSFATPVLLAQRATELWRHDHTHGTLALEPEDTPGHRRVTLTGHPFTTTALARMALSEVLRYVLSLSRVRNVRESHGMNGDALVIVFTWDP
jgi:hypothetical protein